MNETKADKILDLIETAFTTLSEDIRKVTEKVIEIDAKVDRNANLIQGLQRGLDDTRLNYTKIESHIALREGLQEVAANRGLDLHLSAA